LLSEALTERWPQDCSVKITCAKLPTNRLVCTNKNSMKCDVNWIPLNVCIDYWIEVYLKILKTSLINRT